MSDIHAKAKKGIQQLMGRQVIMQILTFASGIILARILGPAQFGLYAIAGFLVSTFAMFGDFGLAPSLIQRKEELTERDLQVSFTLQQILTTVIVIALWIAAPWLAHFYPKAPPATVWLVRALALNLYFNSWRTMSALQLERHLKYDKLTRIDVIGTVIYQSTIITLAVMGYGVWSYVWATLLSGFVGTILMYGASPWPIRFAYDKVIVRELLRFGVPFQFQTIISSVGGWITPFIVGRWIGPQAVGYLTWSSSNGKKPMQYLDSVRRVAFPHFSRIQDDIEEVCLTIERYLAIALPFTGLWFSLILVAAPLVVPVIYTQKWVPALPALALSAAVMNLELAGWLIGTTLMSLGRIRVELNTCIISTCSNLILGYLLVQKVGFIGVPISVIITSVLFMVYPAYNVSKTLPIRLLKLYMRTLVPVVVSCVVGKGVLALLPVSGLVGGVIVSVIVSTVFLCVSWFTIPLWLKQRVSSNRYFALLRQSPAA